MASIKDVDKLFEVLISLLKDQPMTIVKESRNKGSFILIGKATHEQAARSCMQSQLFSGSPAKVLAYLQGMRDTIVDVVKVN